MNDLVLFGAGAAGRYALKYLTEKAKRGTCAAFADNRPELWNTEIDGVPVDSPANTLRALPNATWIATAISRPAATEIRAEIARMGVKTIPLWECLDVCHGLPPKEAVATLANILSDLQSKQELYDQISFRNCPNYGTQVAPSSCSELYFPDWITRQDNEHYVDCGAADGDTVKLFKSKWKKYRTITAFEPDNQNFKKLIHCEGADVHHVGVSDRNGVVRFEHAGDYSSHIDKTLPVTVDAAEECAWVVKLDDYKMDAPTYIKMDIEGAELTALWGARRIIKEHMPVLAICAYHTSDHLWEIPLLIHAIQPGYRIFLRRYAEGAFELVFYAVPPERYKPVIDERLAHSQSLEEAMTAVAVGDHDCPGIHENPFKVSMTLGDAFFKLNEAQASLARKEQK
jgi:FkbM family methyltransferase